MTDNTDWIQLRARAEAGEDLSFDVLQIESAQVLASELARKLVATTDVSRKHELACQIQGLYAAAGLPQTAAGFQPAIDSLERSAARQRQLNRVIPKPIRNWWWQKLYNWVRTW